MTADWAALPAAFTDFLARHAIPLLIKPIRTGDLLTVLDDAYHRLVGA